MRAKGPSAAPAASNWRGCGGATPAKIFENLEPNGAFSCILRVKSLHSQPDVKHIYVGKRLNNRLKNKNFVKTQT